MIPGATDTTVSSVKIPTSSATKQTRSWPRRRRSSLGPQTTKAIATNASTRNGTSQGANGPARFGHTRPQAEPAHMPAPQARLTVTTTTAPTCGDGAQELASRPYPSRLHRRPSEPGVDPVRQENGQGEVGDHDVAALESLIPEQRQMQQHGAQEGVPSQGEEHAHQGDHMPDEPLRQSRAQTQPTEQRAGGHEGHDAHVAGHFGQVVTQRRRWAGRTSPTRRTGPVRPTTTATSGRATPRQRARRCARPVESRGRHRSPGAIAPRPWPRRRRRPPTPDHRRAAPGSSTQAPGPPQGVHGDDDDGVVDGAVARRPG